MIHAAHFDIAAPQDHHMPQELAELLATSERAKTMFDRLPPRDRIGFVDYVQLARTPSARRHRAAVVAMSLYGLAGDLARESDATPAQ